MKNFSMLITAFAVVLGASAQVQRPEIKDANHKQINTVAHFQTQRDAHAKPVRAIAKAQTEAYNVPVNWPLGKSDPVWADEFTILDANNDGKKWNAFSSYIALTVSGITESDDWAISPCVALKAGEEYRFTLDVGVNSGNGAKGQEFEVNIGTENTPAALTQNIMERQWFIPDNSSYVTKEAVFTVEADGNYYFGIHATGKSAEHTLGILTGKNMTISLVNDPDKITPAAAGTIEYTLAPKGELKAHVKYTAPTKDQDGNNLEKIDKVTITNRWYEKFDFENVNPGQTIELDVELYNGTNNRLEGVAYLKNNAGEYVAGESVIITGFYAGLDNPLPPQNVYAQTSADGKIVTLTWSPVGTEGENGGYVDPDKVVYYVFDAFGSYYDPAIATTDATSVTFDYSDLDGQDFFAYQVTAGMDEYYYSLDNSSNITVAGKPYDLPFHESFANAFFTHVWASDPAQTSHVMSGTVTDSDLQTNSDDEEAEPEYLTSQDQDNGFYYVMPYDLNQVWGMQSLCANIKGTTHPVLDFFYQGYGSVIDVMVGTFSKPLEVVKTIDMQKNPTVKGWTLCRTDLSNYLAEGAVRFEIRIRAIHNTDDAIWSVPLDNIRIHDLRDSDIEALYLSAPISAKPGNKVDLTAKVENVGNFPNSSGDVALYRGSELIDTKPLPVMPANSVAFIQLSDSVTLADPDTISYVAKVLYNADMLTSNNSASTIMAVEMPVYPAPAALTASADSCTISLVWDEPDFSSLTEAKEIVDDFDGPEYQPFAIANIGNWTVYDGDKQSTYHLYDYDNPNRSKPMAFEVFDASLAGFPSGYEVGMEGHSGMRYLAAPSCEGQNDNWLISPALSGDAQTISFWAKSYIVSWGEEFTVMYSTTDNAPASFVEVDEIENYPYGDVVPEEWTEFKVALPAGAKYFAIVHNSYDSYALFVDDIQFKSASAAPADLAIKGYKVYRNGEFVSTVTEPKYSETVENGTYEYRVNVVYNYGESRLCPAASATVEVTGISVITMDEAASSDARFFSIDGIERHASSLTPGLYIRKSGKIAGKVIIK